MMGIDVIEISRMRECIDRTGEPFIRRLYSSQERESAQAVDSVRFYSSAFAAKEAVFKAVAFENWSEELDLNQIEIGRDDKGRPIVKLLEPAATMARNVGIEEIQLSISYETNLAIATALVIKRSGAQLSDHQQDSGLCQWNGQAKAI